MSGSVSNSGSFPRPLERSIDASSSDVSFRRESLEVSYVRGGWQPRDAFAGRLKALLDRGSIGLAEVAELTQAAGDDVEHHAFLYLALIRRGLDFTPEAADRLRAFLVERGAHDTRSTLSRLVARHLGEDPVADEAEFGGEVTAALSDRSVTLDEAQALIREAAGSPRRMAMLDLALETRELEFREPARKALRTFLIRAGRNDPGSDLSQAIAELHLLYGVDEPR